MFLKKSSACYIHMFTMYLLVYAYDTLLLPYEDCKNINCTW